MKKLKAIVKRPDERYGHVTYISPTLENLQRHVDGNIEYFYPDKEIVAIVNEEGAVTDLIYNCTINGQQLFGNILFFGRDPNNEEHGLKDLPIDFKTFKRMIEKEMRK